MYAVVDQDGLAAGEPGVVILNGDELSIGQVVRVAQCGVPVAVAPQALVRMRAARDVVDRVLERGDVVYGMNTGLGPLVRHRVHRDNLDQFLVRTVVGHRAPRGAQLDAAVVRAMMLARANGMAKGGVGVRTEVVQMLVAALNASVHPIVRHGGSVGQSDLSEMAQIGEVLIGLGEAEYRGRRLPGAEALAAAGLQPIRLKAKEALGLISANGMTIGHGALVLAEMADLLDTFDLTAALALEGFGGNLTIIHPAAARMKPHPGHLHTAERLRALLHESYLWESTGARNLQDPLSFRCMPQIHGAAHDAYDFVRRTVEIELNSASDNPLVSLEDQSIISVGNFDITAVAVAFDMLRVALAQVAQVANERVHKQLWAQFSGLPTGLGLHDEPVGGLHALARVCASLAAEAQVLANHVSLAYHSQLAEGIEDQASMAPLSVRKTAELISAARQLAAIELIVSARAVELRGQPQLGRGTRIAYEAVQAGATMAPNAWELDFEHVTEMLASGRLLQRVREAVEGATIVKEPVAFAAQRAAPSPCDAEGWEDRWAPR